MLFPLLSHEISIASSMLVSSVGYSWHFGADPRIRTSDSWIRLRIRLLSSLIVKMLKKKNYIFFLITCPQAHHLQFKKFNFFAKICLILQALFQSAQHIYEKRKEPDPDPYLWLMDPDSDPGGPNTSGSPTLLVRKEYLWFVSYK